MDHTATSGTAQIVPVIAVLAKRGVIVPSVFVLPDTSTTVGTDQGCAFQTAWAKKLTIKFNQLPFRIGVPTGITVFGFHDISSQY